ncbi:MAG: serine/threonine-protein kinase [Leptolinea sp.]
MPPQPGSLNGKFLGKYQVLERIGLGGMAEVYRGRHERLDRDVAIKVLHPALNNDPEFLARFEREARLVANLRHPNIVQMFDFDTQGDQVFMVMEYIAGGTLKQRLEELKSSSQFMSLPEVTAFLKQMSAALDYAHSQKMLHRDLKPANILLDAAGNVYLTDFGIAHMLGATKLTTTGSLLGTPAYMSPEQGRGDSLTLSSDHYSLAVILFEMITGEVPFDADTPLALIQKQIFDPPPPLEFYRKDIPAGVSKVIQKALSKNASDRYKSGGELYSAFTEAIQSNVRLTPALAPKSERTNQADIFPIVHDRGSFPIKWALAAVIFLIILLAVGWGVLRAVRKPVRATITEAPIATVTDEALTIAPATENPAQMSATRRAPAIKLCSTPQDCQIIFNKLMESKRYILAAESLTRAVSLVPDDQQSRWAQLKCDQGDVFVQLRKKEDAKIAYRECIDWTHKEAQLQSIRDYAQQKIKDLK